MKKALVTGASGFIGSGLIEELNAAGVETYALMRKTSRTGNLKGLRFIRKEGDLSDFESLKGALSGVDYVFHLAGVTVAPNRESFFLHNAEGTARLAKAAAEIQAHSPGAIKRFVYVSSLAAGGPAGSVLPREESHRDRPVSAYGESKLQGEKELLRFCGILPISIVRPPMVYGPRDRAVFTVIQTVAKRLMPIIKGNTPDGDKYYSSIHVKDLCRGILQAAQTDASQVASGEVFYLTGDEIHTYREILASISTALGRPGYAFHVPFPIVKAIAYGLVPIARLTNKTFQLSLDKLSEIAPDYWICSNKKARERLGFAPEFDLVAGMAHAIRWYKSERWL